MPGVLAMVRHLADFERLLHEVTATEESIRAAMFGPRPVAEAVLGEYRGQPVAYAIFFPSFSTFVGRPGLYVEDLFVQPAHRGKGIGHALLAHLAKLAVERGCARLEWQALRWNERAIGLYRRLGAVPLEEWLGFRMTGEAIRRLAEDG